MQPRRRYLVASGVCVVAVVVGAASIRGLPFAGSANARVHRSSASSTAFVHRTSLGRYGRSIRTSVIGGSTRVRAAARHVARGFGPANRILRITFTSPPPDFALPASATWVTVDVSAPDRPGSAFSIWQAFLAVSAIADGGSPVAGHTVRLVFPDGTTTDAGSAAAGPLPQPADVPSTPASALESALRGAAAAEGLRVTDVGAFDVAGRPAVYATVVTLNPAVFARGAEASFYTLERAAHDAPAAVAGMYVEVRDGSERIVDTGGIATRLQEGVGWRNPAFAAESSTAIR
jgi:hypothetical protein